MWAPLPYVALLAALLAAASQASPVPSEVRPSVSEAAAEEVDSRLSDAVRPVAYALSVSPHYASDETLFGTTGFDGEVAIDLDVARHTDELELHRAATISAVDVHCAAVLSDPVTPDPDPGTEPSTDPTSHPNTDPSHDTGSADTGAHGRLHSDKGWALCAAGRPLAAEVAGWDPVTEKLRVRLASALPAGARLRLVLRYAASIPGGALSGLYATNYTSGRRNASVLATDFQRARARRAFPCLDEPALRAPFDLALQLRPGFDAIANTPQAYRSADHVVVFETTPAMAPSQLGFLVFESASFACTSHVTPTMPTRVRTCARREALQGGAAALSLDTGLDMLRLMGEYTRIPFADSGLTLLQQVALPDVPARGVENWGIVSFRENSLLHEQDGSKVSQMHVTLTLAHEIAHQWFSNLVTTNSWNTTWVNEGLANYMSYIITEEAQPWWYMKSQIAVVEQTSVFQTDSMEDVPSLSDARVQTPEDIDNRFGDIVSSKGAAILRQIENVMGAENFKEALRDFLNERKFLDATSEHLFEALLKHNNETRTQLDNQELLEALRGWTQTPGYPVLFVNRTGPDTFRLTQRRFLQSGAEGSERYHVCLTWMTSRERTKWVITPPAPMGWLGLDEEEHVLKIPTLTADEWVLFNVDQAGYYRVQYDEASWEALERKYREPMPGLFGETRVALVDNAVALARAGKLPWRQAMCMVSAVALDQQTEPWAAARHALNPLARLLHHRTQYKTFVKFLMKNAFKRWDYSDLSESGAYYAKHMVMLLDWSCSVGYGPSLQKAREDLLLHFAGNRVNPDALRVARCCALRGDDGSLWQRLWEEYEYSELWGRSALLPALACTDHAPSLRRYLESSLRPWVVRGQDAAAVFLAVLANPEDVALAVALQFFQETGYEALEKAYGHVGNAMHSIVNAMASRMSETSQKEQLERALGPRAQEHARALRAVEANAQWLRAHEADALEAMARCAAPAAALAAPAVVLLLGALLLGVLSAP